MEGFVTATPRERREDEDAPPPPKASIGKLPKGERPASLPRGKGEVYKYVAEYAGWGKKEKNAGTEQFRYLVRTMHEVEKAIKSGEKTLKDLKGQVRGWKTSVAEKDAVAVYETTGEKMQQKLTDMRGDVGNKHLEKVITPAGGHMGKLNELVLEMQVWLAEESKLGGSQIIEDRLIFAATNLAPLLRLRGRLIFEITAVHELVKQWRVMFEKEKESAKVDVAAKAVKARKAARTEQYTTPGAPPAEERCRAIKAWPGQPEVADTFSLEADEIVFRLEDFGDGWSKVRRQIDGTSGLVPTKRLRLAPLPPAEEEPDEEPPADGGRPPPPELSDDEEMAEEEAAARQAEADDAQVEACTEARMAEVAAAEELARMEADAAECGYGGD